MIKRAVKEMLKLPIHIIDEALYTPASLGGIGLFSLSRKIPLIMRDRIDKAAEKSPLFMSVKMVGEHYLQRITRMIKPGMNKKSAVDRTNAARLEESYYGGGTQQAKNNSASNFFIDRPPFFWNTRDYISAIKLRTNTLPTRGLPYGAREERMCRAGCSRIESLCHLLQKGSLGHTTRMKRHNFVVRRLVKMASDKEWSVVE